MDVFAQLSIAIVLATVIAGIMRVLKQPLIMGYILTGIIIGPSVLGVLNSSSSLSVFSQLGISILLFIVGLNLSPKVIKDVGAVSLVVALSQISFSALLGLLIAHLFGYSLLTSLYLAIAFTFSSTIVVLKLLSDKKDLEKLYGRISLGVLLVQDVVATIALILVNTLNSSQGALPSALLSLIKGIVVTEILLFISYYLLPRFGSFFAKSQEFLFLFSIAWGFGLATLFRAIGFSLEIGALVAGVSLSVSPYAAEISSKLKSLRDFFLIQFFVILGSSMTFANLSGLGLQALVFTVFVIVVKPLIVMITTLLMGYNRKTAFQAGTSLGQISEFSLILAILGIRLGHLTPEILTLVTLVGLFTMAISSYAILLSEKVYPIFSTLLGVLEKNQHQQEQDLLSHYDVVLFGCNRIGYDFIKVFRKLGPAFLAIDFDPTIIKELTDKGINCRYGDAEDNEFLDEIAVSEAKIVISTIPDYDTNSFLLTKVHERNANVIVILISYNVDEALRLYEGGASYVILPHFIGGQFAAHLARDAGFDIGKFHAKRNEHVEYLKERVALGHGHSQFNR